MLSYIISVLENSYFLNVVMAVILLYKYAKPVSLF